MAMTMTVRERVAARKKKEAEAQRITDKKAAHAAYLASIGTGALFQFRSLPELRGHGYFCDQGGTQKTLLLGGYKPCKFAACWTPVGIEENVLGRFQARIDQISTPAFEAKKDDYVEGKFIHRSGYVSTNKRFYPQIQTVEELEKAILDNESLHDVLKDLLVYNLRQAVHEADNPRERTVDSRFCDRICQIGKPEFEAQKGEFAAYGPHPSLQTLEELEKAIAESPHLSEATRANLLENFHNYVANAAE